MACKAQSLEVSRRAVLVNGKFHLSQIYVVTGWLRTRPQWTLGDKEVSDDTRRT